MLQYRADTGGLLRFSSGVHVDKLMAECCCIVDPTSITGYRRVYRRYTAPIEEAVLTEAEYNAYHATHVTLTPALADPAPYLHQYKVEHYDNYGRYPGGEYICGFVTTRYFVRFDTTAIKDTYDTFMFKFHIEYGILDADYTPTAEYSLYKITETDSAIDDTNWDDYTSGTLIKTTAITGGESGTDVEINVPAAQINNAGYTWFEMIVVGDNQISTIWQAIDPDTSIDGVASLEILDADPITLYCEVA